MFAKVIVPPSIEPVSLDEARVFLRIDVPGYSGDSLSNTLIASWIRGAREWIEQEIDFCIGAQTIVCAVSHFGELTGQHRHHWYWHHHTPITSPWWEQGGFNGWNRGLLLPRGPVRSVTSIEYLDTDGNDVTLDSALYRVALDGRLMLDGGATSWPIAKWQHESVRITYVAGLTVPGDREPGAFEKCGDNIIAAIRLLLGHFYINRSASVLDARAPQELPLGVTALLANSRSSIGI